LIEHINTHRMKMSPTTDVMVVRELLELPLVKLFMPLWPGKK
jgi:hypothetical protein